MSCNSHCACFFFFSFWNLLWAHCDGADPFKISRRLFSKAPSLDKISKQRTMITSIRAIYMQIAQLFWCKIQFLSYLNCFRWNFRPWVNRILSRIINFRITPRNKNNHYFSFSSKKFTFKQCQCLTIQNSRCIYKNIYILSTPLSSFPFSLPATHE